MKTVNLNKKYFAALPKHQQDMLPNRMDHFNDIEACIGKNYEVILQIIKNTQNMFENKDSVPANVSSIYYVDIHKIE